MVSPGRNVSLRLPSVGMEDRHGYHNDGNAKVFCW